MSTQTGATVPAYLAPDLAPAGVILLTNRPLAMARHILPTLQAQGIATVLGAAREGFDLAGVLPAPWHAIPHRIAALVEDADVAQRAAQLGFGLVAGFGSGGRAQKLCAAGAEVVLTAPAELANGTLSQAFARKFVELPDALDRSVVLPAVLRERPAVILDPGCLGPAHEGAALRAQLFSLAGQMPIAVLGGGPVDNGWSMLPAGGVTVHGDGGLGLASAHTQDLARQRVSRAAAVLDKLMGAFPGLRISAYPFCVHVTWGAAAPPHNAGLRRALIRVLSLTPGMELRAAADAYLICPATRWTLADAARVLLKQWRRKWGARHLLYLGATQEHEAALHELRTEATGVRLALQPVPTSAKFRISNGHHIGPLLRRLSKS